MLRPGTCHLIAVASSVPPLSLGQFTTRSTFQGSGKEESSQSTAGPEIAHATLAPTLRTEISYGVPTMLQGKQT